MIAVKGAKGLMGEIGNIFRVAAGLMGIGGAGHEAAEDMMKEQADGVGKGALHLVIDHALKLQLAILPVLMIMPAFLFKGGAAEQRIEHHITVHIHDVEIFLQVTGGKGIVGDIRTGHGVEKGHEPALVDLAEDIAHRILPGTHEHRMLKDMGHAGGIGGNGMKGHGKGLVGVTVFDGQQGAAQDIMLEEIDIGADLIDVRLALEGKGGIGVTENKIHR